MNPEEAKAILLVYRGGRADAQEPEIAAALEAARRDPELARWLKQHLAFQQAMRAKFRRIEAPARLKAQILAQQNIVRPQVWRLKPAWLAMAAGIVLVLGLVVLWMGPRTPDRFADFQARMVRTALREYRMDVVTNDMRQVRRFLAEKGAPADYALTQGLERLHLTGGGLLRWRDNPVSMVCFDRGDQQMLFLFVIDRARVPDPPPATPRTSKVNKLLTASWTQGDKTYVLAGPEEAGFVSRYL